MTIQDFKNKYGTMTFGLVIGKFIQNAPEFPGDIELAKELGQISADLESALEQIPTTPESSVKESKRHYSNGQPDRSRKGDSKVIGRRIHRAKAKVNLGKTGSEDLCAVCGGDWYQHPVVGGKILWCAGSEQEMEKSESLIDNVLKQVLKEGPSDIKSICQEAGIDLALVADGL